VPILYRQLRAALLSWERLHGVHALWIAPDEIMVTTREQWKFWTTISLQGSSWGLVEPLYDRPPGAHPLRVAAELYVLWGDLRDHLYDVVGASTLRLVPPPD
jgi:hypothetical protein